MSARFRIWRDVLDELGVAATHRASVERGGLLLGREPADASGPTCTGYRELEPIDGLVPWLNGLQRDWPRLSRRLERSAPDRLLGWVWIRPGGGVGLTPEAQLVHRTLFGLPWQVMCVVDASTGGLAFFGTDAERALVNIPFDLVLPAGRRPPTADESDP